jgi:hypothetical protein
MGVTLLPRCAGRRGVGALRRGGGSRPGSRRPSRPRPHPAAARSAAARRPPRRPTACAPPPFTPARYPRGGRAAAIRPAAARRPVPIAAPPCRYLNARLRCVGCRGAGAAAAGEGRRRVAGGCCSRGTLTAGRRGPGREPARRPAASSGGPGGRASGGCTPLSSCLRCAA